MTTDNRRPRRIASHEWEGIRNGMRDGAILFLLTWSWIDLFTGQREDATLHLVMLLTLVVLDRQWRKP